MEQVPSQTTGFHSLIVVGFTFLDLQFCISVFVFFSRTKDEFEDTKGVNRNRISMNRQRTGQKKKYKEINNDLSRHTHTTKAGVTRTALKSGR